MYPSCDADRYLPLASDAIPVQAAPPGAVVLIQSALPYSLALAVETPRLQTFATLCRLS